MSNPVQRYWQSLSPGVQRGVAWSLGAAVVLAIAAVGVQTAGPPTPRTPQERLVRNLLTDTDPRSLGIEGLAARLERMEGQVAKVTKATEKPPEATAVDPAAFRDQQTALEQLRGELDALKRRQEETPPPAPVPTAKPPGTLAVPTDTTAPRAAPPLPPTLPPRSERPPDQLFRPNPPVGPSPAVPGAARSGGSGRALEIRVVAAKPPSGSGRSAPGQSAPGQSTSADDGGLFLPAGSLLSGVLINGLDAPTGQSARQQPTPALVRLKDLAILPNRFRADVRECFIILGGFGDLAAERAYLRAETLTCVRTDGGVIEVPLDAYAVGEDGKVGIRGRLVSKQGTMIARALQAGFLTSFSKLFTQIPVTAIPTGAAASTMQFQSMFSGQAAGAGAVSGMGGALEKLAEYYMNMAEQTFPILEVDAGRGIELVVNKGTTLKLI